MVSQVSTLSFSTAIDMYRGMSIQWALNLLPALLPEELMARLQSTSVDPSYVFPESGNSMRMYNAETGDTLKVSCVF